MVEEFLKVALEGVATGVDAALTWYVGSFIGNPIKELLVLRAKVIEQLIRLDHFENKSNNTDDFRQIVNALQTIAAQTQAAFLSITRGLKRAWVRFFKFDPDKGADSLLRLTHLLNA